MEFLYYNFLRSNILHLPSQESIKWKLKKRGDVEKVKRKFRGKEYVDYDILDSVILISDGVSYQVEVRELSRKNSFLYSNPESLLEYYPEVDELIYMCEIINLIKIEFQIWN